MEETFKPKYTISHWWLMLEPFFGFLIPGAFFLEHQALSKEIAASANIPFTGPRTSELVCIGLIGLLVLCRVLSFLSQDCLRKIEFNDDRLILHRVLGKKIEASYDQLIWIGNHLRVNKTHSFPIIRIENKDVLKELLTKHVYVYACDQQIAVVDKPLKESTKLNWWHDIFALLGILIVVAIIIAFYYLSKVEITDEMIWIFDGVLALGAGLSLISIVRKLFVGTGIIEN